MGMYSYVGPLGPTVPGTRMTSMLVEVRVLTRRKPCCPLFRLTLIHTHTKTDSSD